MTITVKIKNNHTKEIRVWHSDLDWNGTFVWQDGNFNCDCNRGGFFAQAGDEEDKDEPCGHSKYTILSIESQNEIVYSEPENA